ncbi:hypothetical protein GCM10010116_19300 [Microbispora rosea subsp. aerata]|nr:hypothetical protein GCM10010116_19300 [Microbispora rosea subsp. aerata]GIH53454.1 hypothetical protein Mro02_03680 [Microbispora rosea subsp. aerata]GLJ83136.1 hypothetical protein GCM10017588_18620 [Microbispora rosea subsp. aerata]
MRRLPALLSAVLAGAATTLTVPGAAEAAVPDVVGAVRNQLAKGASVKFTQYGGAYLGVRSKYDSQAHPYRFDLLQNGTLLLGRRGVVAANTTRQVRFNRYLLPLAKERAAEGDLVSQSLLAQTKPYRWVNVNNRFYSTGRLWTAGLPKGKTWAARGKRSAGATVFGDQVINIFEIATLKALIADADRRRYNLPNPAGKTPDLKVTGIYEGTITFAELYRLSPTFREVAGRRPDPSYANLVLHWYITFDRRGLPFKVASRWTTQEQKKPYSDGGAAMDIQSWGAAKPTAGPKSAQVAAVRAPAGGLPEFDDMVEVIREDARPTIKR